MTDVPPHPAPSDDTVRALASIDLSGGDEAPVQTFGRILSGIVLLVLGGAAALGFMAVYLGGAFIPGMADWQEWLGDGLLFAAIIAFALAVTGFELLRRGRKARAAEAREAADVLSRLGAAGALDGTATAADVENALSGPRTGDMDPGSQKPIPGPRETHL